MKLVLAVAVAVSISVAVSPVWAGTQAQVVGSVQVPLDGTEVTLPATGESGQYAIRISGTFRCGIDEREYDAAFRTDTSGNFSQPHRLLELEPAGLPLSDEDGVRHTYTYDLSSGDGAVMQAPTVRLDTERLGSELGRPPSEVRESLSGDLKAELLLAPVSSPASWIVAAVLLPVLFLGVALIVMIGAAWKGARQSSEDIEAVRRRISRKAALAIREIGTEEDTLGQLSEHVRELRDDAEDLAARGLALRTAADSRDEEESTEQVEQQAGRGRGEPPVAVAADPADGIELPRRTYDELRAERDRDKQIVVRLSAVEAALDHLRLKLPGLRGRTVDTDSIRVLLDTLSDEIDAVRDALAETVGRTQQGERDLS